MAASLRKIGPGGITPVNDDNKNPGDQTPGDNKNPVVQTPGDKKDSDDETSGDKRDDKIRY
eukprot:CAMPEP_0176433612 /NCGR_PEP_ID=MMETSP0127-20121128/16137_1 /TAXON_ID=938130 /ORGANISM="Platyophrya macrostoma, Strain WH" /LENGTH=60 /DNA_ID=CAMNT_0017816095 /DNA_START=16 /DNA_END=195 /DNA_ORIENTATION=+